MAWAASSRSVSRSVTKRCGSRVWSMMPTLCRRVRARWCVSVCRRFSWGRDSEFFFLRSHPKSLAALSCLSRGIALRLASDRPCRNLVHHLETLMPIDYEVEYDNRARVPELPEIFARWERETAAYRQARPAPNWASPTVPRRARPSICFPPAAPTPRSPCSSMAAGGARSIPRFQPDGQGPERARRHRRGGRLRSVPAVSVATIIEEMRAACLFLWRRFDKRIMVYGHSAGGHLAACMVATDFKTLSPDAPPIWCRQAMRFPASTNLRRCCRFPSTRTSGSTRRARELLADHLARAARPRARRRGRRRELSKFFRHREIVAGLAPKRGAKRAMRRYAGSKHFTAIDALADPDSAMTRRLVELASADGGSGSVRRR